MRITMLVRSVALALACAMAASHSPSALADTPPLDFPTDCLPSVYSQLFVPPEWEGRVTLPNTYNNGTAEEFVSFWRVSCGGGEAALLMRMGFTDPLFDPQVRMPRLTVRQNGREVDINALRVATGFVTQAPALVPAGAPNGSPGVFVLTTGGSRAVDLRGAMILQLRNPITGDVGLAQSIGPFASVPTPVPLNGRLVGNFYDPAKSGEGVLVEIGDFGPAPAGQRQRRYLQYNWFTYDNDGRPFWISGSAEFLEGDTHVHMPAIYRGGGRFAGRQAPADVTSWGTVDMEFADCNTLRIDYSGNAGLPSNVPSGSGHLEWKRLTSVNGYGCN